MSTLCWSVDFEVSRPIRNCVWDYINRAVGDSLHGPLGVIVSGPVWDCFSTVVLPIESSLNDELTI